MPLLFSAAFWPSLAAGIISCTFAGVLVGGLVIVLEFRMEKRRLHHEYEAEFAICKERLRIALSRPGRILLEGPAESSPAHVELAMIILREYPIILWREYLYKGHNKTFLHILRFTHAYTSFSLAAGELGNRLRTVVRKYHATRTLEAAHDAGLICFFTGNALGFPYEEILPWIPAADPHELREGFLALSYDRDLSPMVEPYKKSRKELEDAADALWKSFQDVNVGHLARERTS